VTWRRHAAQKRWLTRGENGARAVEFKGKERKKEKQQER